MALQKTKDTTHQKYEMRTLASVERLQKNEDGGLRKSNHLTITIGFPPFLQGVRDIKEQYSSYYIFFQQSTNYSINK